jgi:hypothetical protein
VEAELAFVALVLLAWQAVRIPLEGNLDVSLAHAESVLGFERALSLDVEGAIIERVSDAGLTPLLTWLYTNIHLPILFAFLAAVRLYDPARYPRVRTIFVLSFVPAVFVIGLYPLAPPRWHAAFGLEPTPDQADLAGTTGELMHNSTAAAASQHFGFALFVAAVALWIFPRSWIALASLAYPALVFLVIVGTGNHYVVDCLVGSATFALAALVAWYLHRPATAASPAPAAGVLGAALGYGLVVWGIVSLNLLNPSSPKNLLPAFVLAAGLAAVLLPRIAKEPVAESS